MSAELTRNFAETGVLDAGNRGLLTRYFFGVLREREEFDGLYLGTERGEFVYVNRDTQVDGAAFRVKQITTRPERKVRMQWYTADFESVLGRVDPEDAFEPRTRPWYRAAVEARDVAWTPPYVFFTSGLPGITVSAPVHEEATGRLVGAVGVDIGIDALSTFLDELDISPRGSAAIVSEAGDIIAHSDPSMVAVGKGEGEAEFHTVAGGEDPVLAEAEASIVGGLGDLFPGEIRVARFEAGGEPWLGAVQRLRLQRTPWTVVTYMPEADILEPLWRVRNSAILVSLFVLLATAVLGAVFVRAVLGRD